jgi:FtsP/CotA-like multicopper oxidase with cupredoxin domain
VHEEGTFFYHTHVPMQEAFGMVGWFIVHPKKIWDPPVDRTFRRSTLHFGGIFSGV